MPDNVWKNRSHYFVVAPCTCIDTPMYQELLLQKDGNLPALQVHFCRKSFSACCIPLIAATGTPLLMYFHIEVSLQSLKNCCLTTVHESCKVLLQTHFYEQLHMNFVGCLRRSVVPRRSTAVTFCKKRKELYFHFPVSRQWLCLLLMISGNCSTCCGMLHSLQSLCSLCFRFRCQRVQACVLLNRFL